jgi:hypothetical protein
MPDQRILAVLVPLEKEILKVSSALAEPDLTLYPQLDEHLRELERYTKTLVPLSRQVSRETSDEITINAIVKMLELLLAVSRRAEAKSHAFQRIISFDIFVKGMHGVLDVIEHHPSPTLKQQAYRTLKCGVDVWPTVVKKVAGGHMNNNYIKEHVKEILSETGRLRDEILKRTGCTDSDWLDLD